MTRSPDLASSFAAKGQPRTQTCKGRLCGDVHFLGDPRLLFAIALFVASFFTVTLLLFAFLTVASFFDVIVLAVAFLPVAFLAVPLEVIGFFGDALLDDAFLEDTLFPTAFLTGALLAFAFFVVAPLLFAFFVAGVLDVALPRFVAEIAPRIAPMRSRSAGTVVFILSLTAAVLPQRQGPLDLTGDASDQVRGAARYL